MARQPPPRPRRRPPGPTDGRPAHPSSVTSEALYTDEESAFLRAVADYKARTGRQFPALTELLGVLKSLGYRKG